MRRLLVIAIVMTAACGGGADAPSCQQALGHYYSAGCTYFDQTETPPPQIPQNEMVAFCQFAASEAPDSCQDDLDAWLECNDAVPDMATSNADCDCSNAYMALLRCD